MKKIIYVLIIVMCCTMAGCKKGDDGINGKDGAQGPKGDKGNTGATGPQGAKGDKGETGAQGTKGDKGDTGPQGPVGDVNVVVQDIQVKTEDWKQFGNTFIYYFTPAIDFNYTQVFMLLAPATDIYIPLPFVSYSGEQVDFEIETPVNPGAKGWVGIYHETLTGKRPPLTQTFRVISYKGITPGALKANAGGMDYNNLKRYFKLK